MKRALSVLVASVGLAAGSSLLGASSASAAPETAQACYLYANAPVASASGRIEGSGGRAGCSNSATFTVYVYQDRSFQPDPEIARATGSGNQGVVAYGACSTAGAGSYYTFTESSTGSTQESARVGLC